MKFIIDCRSKHFSARHNLLPSVDRRILVEMIIEFLVKGAIQKVGLDTPVFYSHLFAQKLSTVNVLTNAMSRRSPIQKDVQEWSQRFSGLGAVLKWTCLLSGRTTNCQFLCTWYRTHWRWNTMHLACPGQDWTCLPSFSCSQQGVDQSGSTTLQSD